MGPEVAHVILAGSAAKHLGLRQAVVVASDVANHEVTLQLPEDPNSTVGPVYVIGTCLPSYGEAVWLLRNGSDLVALASSFPNQPRVLDTWRGTSAATWYGPGSSEAVPSWGGANANVSGYLYAGYRYRIAVTMPLYSTVATDVGLLRVRDTNVSGATYGYRRCAFAAASLADGFHLRVEYDCAATGLYTFCATVQRSSGTGNMSVVVASDKTIDMSLELVGGPSVTRAG